MSLTNQYVTCNVYLEIHIKKLKTNGLNIGKIIVLMI